MKYRGHFLGGLAAVFAGPGFVYAAETLLKATPATQGLCYIGGGLIFIVGGMTAFLAIQAEES